MSALVVNTNTQSIFAQRALRNNTIGLQRNIERLSTGFRINRAADDAAGLSIANKLTTSIRGLEKAKQNAGDGISLIQTAEGGLQIIQDNLQRIRELVIQGVNGTNGINEQNALQREINERIKVIDDIAKSTKFNGIDLLNSGSSDITLQTGSNNGETTVLTFTANSAANSGIKIDITQATSGTATDTYGEIVENISHVAANETTKVPVFALNNLKITEANANAVTAFDNGAAVIAQTTLSAGEGSLQGRTPDAVSKIDTMIDNISRMRSYLGASQNALESKIEYMDIAVENAAASRSRIQDVDIALESSALVKNQILQQTASTMLSQANQTPQIALQLLGR
jgi:flagellin